MSYSSTAAPDFLATVDAWIAQDGEVLTLTRYSHSAGNREYEFHGSAEGFRGWLLSLPARTCVTVLRGRHLPLRGRVDDAFVQSALSQIQDGKEWLIVALEKTVAGSLSWFRHTCGETLAEFQHEIQDYAGRLVAVGHHPDWRQDNDVVLSAVTPEPDGSVVTGVY